MQSQKGQSLVEFGIAVPILIMFLTGVYSLGTLASDRVTSGHAVRAGARLAGVLGGTDSGNIDQDGSDRKIVQNVMAVAQSLNYANVTQVDIYPACAPPPPGLACHSNQYYAGGVIDRRLPNGNPIAAQTFTMAMRQQIPPNETSIGVRLTYSYAPPITLGFFQLNLQEYAVMKAVPSVQ